MTENNFFCLFDTGDFATVIVEQHENDPSEPVQGFFVLDGGSGFSLAAKRAAVKVYSVLKNQGVAVRKYSAMFDLSMKSTQDLGSISGQSGGLAFALALASEITKKGHGPVAATGIIEADGSVGKVRQADLDAKIEAACRALARGGLMLYPRDNHISDRIRRTLKERGIGLVPVMTVVQALHISGIIDDHGGPVEAVPRKTYLKFLPIVLLLLLILTIGLFFLNRRPEPSVGSDSFVSEAKDHGEFKPPIPGVQPVSEAVSEKKMLDKGFE